MTNVNEYVKVARAAEMLEVAQNMVRAWAERGILAVHRNPDDGYRPFRRSEVHEFLKRLDAKTTNPSTKN